VFTRSFSAVLQKFTLVGGFPPIQSEHRKA